VRLSAPKILEPIHCHFGVADCVLFLMAEVVLQRARVVTIVRKLVPTGMPEHVGVDAKWHLGGLAEALDEPRFWTILLSLYARARRRPCVTMFGFSRQGR
jgi:hypothetical protein